jgi:hypothetical protein
VKDLDIVSRPEGRFNQQRSGLSMKALLSSSGCQLPFSSGMSTIGMHLPLSHLTVVLESLPPR